MLFTLTNEVFSSAVFAGSFFGSFVLALNNALLE